MNKKAIIINIIILGLLSGFVVLSMTFYYLIPIGQDIVDFLEQAIIELMNMIGR